MNSDWKRFEKLTQRIQRQLAPGACVQHNEVVAGKSGAKNQLDVTLRARVGQFDFFCVIECKNWVDKVGISTVREFVSVLEDVRAHCGVIVSASGFTSEARTYALSKGIKLYRLIDAEAENWSELPLIPAVVGRIYLVGARSELIDCRSGESIWLTDKAGDRAPDDKVYLFDIQGNRYIKIRQFLEERWDDIFQEREPGSDEWFETEEGRYFLYEGEGKHVPAKIRYCLEGETTWYFGNLSLRQHQGFFDEGAGQYLHSSYETEPLIFKEIVSSWQSTKNKDEIPISPEHVFFMGHFFRKTVENSVAGVVIEKQEKLNDRGHIVPQKLKT